MLAELFKWNLTLYWSANNIDNILLLWPCVSFKSSKILEYLIFCPHQHCTVWVRGIWVSWRSDNMRLHCFISRAVLCLQLRKYKDEEIISQPVLTLNKTTLFWRQCWLFQVHVEYLTRKYKKCFYCRYFRGKKIMSECA